MVKIPGIVKDGEPTTFEEVIEKINPDKETLYNLSVQPDDGPIVMLNLIRFKPRGDNTIYSLYGKEADPQVRKTGSFILYYGEVITYLDSALGFDTSWDGIVLPVYSRRKSFLELQNNPIYQKAIPYRVAGTYARLLYVIGDSDTMLEDLLCIKEYYDSKESFNAIEGEIYIAELLRFREDNGRQLFSNYLRHRTPLIETAGAKHVLSRAAETPIVSEQVWDHLLLTRFPSLDSILALYKSEEWNELNSNRLKSLEDCIVVATKAIPLP